MGDYGGGCPILQKARVSVLGFAVPLTQACSRRGASVQSDSPHHVLLSARLTEGAGFHVRKPVASSPQLVQMKSCQLHFRDGKLRLSQGQGLAGDTSWEGECLCPNVRPPHTTRGRGGSADQVWPALLTVLAARPHILIHPSERRAGTK